MIKKFSQNLLRSPSPSKDKSIQDIHFMLDLITKIRKKLAKLTKNKQMGEEGSISKLGKIARQFYTHINCVFNNYDYHFPNFTSQIQLSDPNQHHAISRKNQ